MKKLLALMALIFIGTVGWRVGESLSSDAVSMAIGLLLGVMAGIPTALLVLASDRRQRAYDENAKARAQGTALPTPYIQQPPVIVVTGQSSQPTLPQGYRAAHPGPGDDAAQPMPQGRPQERVFRMIGEPSADVDEW